MCIHTFGEYLDFHPHLHALVADGLFTRDGLFHVMPEVNLVPLEELFRARVITFLVGKGLLPPGGRLFAHLDACTPALLSFPPRKRSFRPVPAGECPHRLKSDFLSIFLSINSIPMSIATELFTVDRATFAVRRMGVAAWPAYDGREPFAEAFLAASNLSTPLRCAHAFAASWRESPTPIGATELFVGVPQPWRAIWLDRAAGIVVKQDMILRLGTANLATLAAAMTEYGHTEIANDPVCNHVSSGCHLIHPTLKRRRDIPSPPAPCSQFLFLLSVPTTPSSARGYSPSNCFMISDALSILLNRFDRNCLFCVGMLSP